WGFPRARESESMVAKGRFAMRPGLTLREDYGLGAEVQRAWPRGARGPPSAGPSWQAEHRLTRGSGSDGRERSDACDPWGRTLATERLGDVGLGGVPGLGERDNAEPDPACARLSQALGPPPPSCPGRGSGRRF